ncbi:MAG: hypothetical protein K0S57_2522 [Ramlibacter sp.]|jgi:hypothetical protein|nr:hypothetical protein [Ramlibacter sp.]
MGLSDRDYMRDREGAQIDRNRPFTPPDNSIGWPWILLFWLLAGFILFKLYVSYGPIKQIGDRGTVRIQQKAVAPESPEPHAPALQEPVQRARATEFTRNEDPVPQFQPQIRDTAIPSNTIYLCRAYSGGTFWANTHCNQHSALIERIAYVPPGLPFQQQVAIASEQQRHNASIIHSQTTVTQTRERGPGEQKAECQALDARVVQLDALARQPQSAQMQDWIAGQRKEARDRQFRLRC